MEIHVQTLRLCNQLWIYLCYHIIAVNVPCIYAIAEYTGARCPAADLGNPKKITQLHCGLDCASDLVLFRLFPKL